MGKARDKYVWASMRGGGGGVDHERPGDKTVRDSAAGQKTEVDVSGVCGLWDAVMTLESPC